MMMMMMMVCMCVCVGGNPIYEKVENDHPNKYGNHHLASRISWKCWSFSFKFNSMFVQNHARLVIVVDAALYPHVMGYRYLEVDIVSTMPILTE